MRKKTLSALLALCLLLSMVAPAMAAEETGGGALPEQLSAPSELKWISTDENGPGVATWKITGTFQGEILFEIYREGKAGGDAKRLYRATYTYDPNHKQEEFQLRDMIFGCAGWDSGDYYFTVQNMGDDISYFDSEVVSSKDTADGQGLFHYEKPAQQLETPAQGSWEWPAAQWEDRRDTDEQIRAYQVDYGFSETKGGEIKSIGSSYGATPGEKDRFFHETMIGEWGGGYYYFRTRAVSKNILEQRTSEYSEWSDGSDLIRSSLEIADQLTLLEELDNIEDIREALGNIDQDRLQDALRIDPQGEGAAQALADLEAKAGGPAKTEVADELKDKFDQAQISIVGAGLNIKGTENGDVTLKVGKPKQNNHVRDELYNSAVAVDFSMKLDNIPNAKELLVPVKITMPVPSGVNPDFLAVLHYKEDGTFEEVRTQIYQKDGVDFVTFVLTGFSDFTITETAQPGEPDVPGEGEPEQPGKPDVPGEGEPEQPGKPDVPGEGETEQPGKPDIPGEGEPEQPSEPEQPAVKLSAPTDLAWHKYFSDEKEIAYKGSISWKEDLSQPDHKTEVKVYRQGESEAIWDSSWISNQSGKTAVSRSDHDFVCNESMTLEAGRYYFTIQLKGDGKTCADSEIATSETWDYTPPAEKALAAPTGLKWNWPKALWSASEDADIKGYIVDFYYSKDKGGATSADDDALKRIRGFFWLDGDEWDAHGTLANPFFSLLEKDRTEAGYYYFTVRAISRDVTEVKNSADSALSAAYRYEKPSSSSNDSDDSDDSDSDSDSDKNSSSKPSAPDQGEKPGSSSVSAAEQFADVKAGVWYEQAVDYVISKGLMKGTGDTTFAPGATLSRAMLAQILYNAEGAAAKGEGKFSDVAQGAWYADAVNWAAGSGIVTGNADGSFNPNGAITREQVAVILYRYAQQKGYDVSQKADLSAFEDAASVSDYAKEAMAWANGAGLINGMTKTSLAPGGNATRAQVAAILMRFLQSVEK